jgi:hypothetical protein
VKIINVHWKGISKELPLLYLTPYYVVMTKHFGRDDETEDSIQDKTMTVVIMLNNWEK